MSNSITSVIDDRVSRYLHYYLRNTVLLLKVHAIWHSKLGFIIYLSIDFDAQSQHRQRLALESERARLKKIA